jgi:shikimate 5-dehydrogenase
MPLKEASCLCDAVQPRRPQVRAANCLVRHEDGSLEAFNFDIEGVATPLRCLSSADDPDHVASYVYVIGSGGAARAAGFGARSAGYADVRVFTRNREKGLELVAAMLGALSAKRSRWKTSAPSATWATVRASSAICTW